MARDRKVLEEELQYLGPVAIAVFLDAGWIRLWPMAWTKAGLHAIANGYGRWEGTEQVLPRTVDRLPDGAAHWLGRRARVPAGTNLPMVA